MVYIYFTVNNTILNYFSILYQISLKGKVIEKNTITSIAIGGFDGMHLAHQKLFSKLGTNGGIIVIQTHYANLSPVMYRKKYTNYPLYFYPLTNIKHLTGIQFVKLLEEEFPNLEKIVVGYDFHFGHQAAYNCNDLATLFKGIVEIVDEFKLDGISIHSKAIRAYLRDGDIQKANKMLGHNYCLTGLCIQGQGLGKKQFVPTININVLDFLIPQEGIYLTKTKIKDRDYNSITFIGHRVTTDGKFAVETHILSDNFMQEIPKNIEIEFLKKTRNNIKYDKFEDLKKQIEEDIKNALVWFGENR